MHLLDHPVKKCQNRERHRQRQGRRFDPSPETETNTYIDKCGYRTDLEGLVTTLSMRESQILSRYSL